MPIINIFPMFPFFKKNEEKIPTSTVAAILVACLSLILSFGVIRWSWLLLDEQIQLRKDFMELKEEQAQVNIQYEFWLKKIQDERTAIKK